MDAVDFMSMNTKRFNVVCWRIWRKIGFHVWVFMFNPNTKCKGKGFLKSESTLVYHYQNQCSLSIGYHAPRHQSWHSYSFEFDNAWKIPFELIYRVIGVNKIRPSTLNLILWPEFFDVVFVPFLPLNMFRFKTMKIPTFHPAKAIRTKLNKTSCLGFAVFGQKESKTQSVFDCVCVELWRVEKMRTMKYNHTPKYMNNRYL